MLKYRKLFFKIFSQLLICAAVFFAVSAYQERNLLPTNKTSAPYFSLPLLNSEGRISLGQLKEQKTVLYFFAPWCSICRFSLPNLAQAHADGKVNALAIALDYESAQQVTDFANELNLTMPIALGSANTQRQYKISAYPTYYVIDESLNIVARSMGYSSELGLIIRGN